VSGELRAAFRLPLSSATTQAFDGFGANEMTLWDHWWQFLFYFFAVIFVVGLAWLAARIVSRRGAEVQSQSRYLNVLDRMQLTPNRFIHLVSVAGRVLLIGQGEKEFTLLMEISEEELVQYLDENPLRDLDSSGLTFLKNLQDSIGRMNKAAPRNR